MGELSRIAYQVRHYRQLAQIATDCAGKDAAHSEEYLELAKQWTVFADRLEYGESDDDGPSAEAGPVGR